MNNLITNSVLILMMVWLSACSKNQVSQPQEVSITHGKITDKEFNVTPHQWTYDNVSKWYTPEFAVCPLDEDIVELTSYLDKKDIAAILPVESTEAAGTFSSVYSVNATQQYTVQFFFFPNNTADSLKSATKFIVHVTR